jgi:hypothetical protein
MLSMLLALSAASPTGSSTAATARTPASASVRIVRGAEIRFTSATRVAESIRRKSAIRERDGSVRSASLIEFY